jgi:DNA-binding NarL/FixJ family response regulator
VTVERTERAVLFDTHPLWLDAVETVLTRLEIGVAAKTTRAEHAAEAVRDEYPELLVADLQTMPPGLDGPTFLSRCHSLRPGLRTVVLSGADDRERIEEALAAGASAYVLKSAHPDDLASAIRQAFEASMFFAPLTRSDHPKLRRSPVEEAGLTPRETEILRLAAEGRSNAELARSLWVTEQTVKFHLSNVYRKLGVANRTEAALWAHSRGLLDTQTPAYA